MKANNAKLEEGTGRLLPEMDRLCIFSAACFLTGTLILLNGGISGNYWYNQVDRNATESDIQPTTLTDSKPVLKNWNNLIVDKWSNYSDTLIKAIELNTSSTSSCYHDATQTAKLVGLPAEVDGKVTFTTDVPHQLTLVSYGTNGTDRCAGGDYYEVDLHDKDNVHYRSRLPTVDFGNGSYGLELKIPSGFAGAFIVEIWLLFNNWHGMDYACNNWVREMKVITQELELVVENRTEAFPSGMKSEHQAPKELRRCTHDDFSRTTWQGRWTRSWYNDNCRADNDKRFRCLPREHFYCEKEAGWCEGPLGRIESNGWQYSAHCTFKILERDEAWNCLNGRWFMMWGDSNFQDTIRNLMLFVLDWEIPIGQSMAEFQMDRSFETGFVNPRKLDQMFRVSQLFNGAVHWWGNQEGLTVLQSEEHQKAILSHFEGEWWPDTIIMNSGLHDSLPFKTIQEYVDIAEFTVDWWTKLYNSIEHRRRPQLLWRTTVAPAGFSRRMPSNPNKMEMFNLVMVEKLQKARDVLPVKIVDGFDLTFPFHYDNNFSDGGHYGRAPGVHLPPWNGDPHWYFVDLMLAHILLNALCPST